MPAYTPNTVTDPDSLLRNLELGAEQGYALDESEQELGVRCIAVPLADSPALAAVSVSGPEGRLSTQAIERIADAVQRTARALSRELNGNLPG
jgi:IclR family acetate operon transcriptional repressor